MNSDNVVSEPNNVLSTTGIAHLVDCQDVSALRSQTEVRTEQSSMDSEKNENPKNCTVENDNGVTIGTEKCGEDVFVIDCKSQSLVCTPVDPCIDRGLNIVTPKVTENREILKYFSVPGERGSSAKETSDIVHARSSCTDVNEHDSINTESSHLYIGGVEKIVSEDNFAEPIFKTSYVTGDELTSAGVSGLFGVMEQEAKYMSKQTSLQRDVMHCSKSSCTDVREHCITTENLIESESEQTESSRLHVDSVVKFVSEDNFVGQVSKTNDVSDRELISAGNVNLSGVKEQMANDISKQTSLPSSNGASEHDSISVENLNAFNLERTASYNLRIDERKDFVSDDNFAEKVFKTSARNADLSGSIEHEADNMSEDEEYDFDIIGDIYSVDTSSVMKEWINNGNKCDSVIDDNMPTCDKDTANGDVDMADTKSKVIDEAEENVDVISNLPDIQADNINASDNMETCLVEDITKVNIASGKDDGIDIYGKDNEIDMQATARVESRTGSDIETSHEVCLSSHTAADKKLAVDRKTVVCGKTWADERTLSENETEVCKESTCTISKTVACEEIDSNSINNVVNKSETEKETETREAGGENKACNETVDGAQLGIGTEASGKYVVAKRCSDPAVSIGSDGCDNTSSRLAEHTACENQEPSAVISTNEGAKQTSVSNSGIDTKNKSDKTSLVITGDGSIRLQVGNAKDDAPDIGLHRLMVAPDQSNKMQLYLVPTKDMPGRDNRVFMVLPSQGTGWAVKANQMGTKSLVPVFANKGSVAEKDEHGNIKLVYTEGIIISKDDQNKSTMKHAMGTTEHDDSTRKPQITTLFTSGMGVGREIVPNVCSSSLPQVKQTSNQSNMVVKMPESSQMPQWNVGTTTKTSVTLYGPPKTSSFRNGVFVPIKKQNQNNVSSSSVTGSKPKPLSTVIFFPSQQQSVSKSDALHQGCKTVSILKTNPIILGTQPTNIWTTKMPGSTVEPSIISGSDKDSKSSVSEISEVLEKRIRIKKPRMDIKIDASHKETNVQRKDNIEFCKNKNEYDKIERSKCYVILSQLEIDSKKETFDKDDLAILDKDMKSCSVQCRSIFVHGLFNLKDTAGCFTEEELDQLHIETCTAGCHKGTKTSLVPRKFVLRSVRRQPPTPFFKFHNFRGKRKLGRLSPVENSSPMKMQRQSDGITVLNTHAGRVVLQTQQIPSTSNVPGPGMRSLLKVSPNNLTFGDLVKIGTPLTASSSAPVFSPSSKLPFSNNSQAILVLNNGLLKNAQGTYSQTISTAAKQVVPSTAKTPATGNCVLLLPHASKSVAKNYKPTTVSVQTNAVHPHLSDNPPIRFVKAIPKPEISIIPRSVPSTGFQPRTTAPSMLMAVADSAMMTSKSDGNSRMNLDQKHSNTESEKNSQKFYLIRVGDKNILMPMKNDNLQPRAYILDSKSCSSLKTNSSDALTVNPRVFSKIKNMTATKDMQLQNPAHSSVNNKHNFETNPGVKLNTPGIKIKSEPDTKGYGDGNGNGKDTFPVRIKAEPMNRGYSDEFSHAQTVSSLSSTTSANALPGSDESNVKTKESQEERIHRLKELLKKQNKVLDEMRLRQTSVIDK